MANLGFLAGGFADALNTGLDRNRQAQYQQQELQIQQQGQQLQQKRFDQSQYMKLYENAVQHMQEFFDHTKVVGGDVKQAATIMGPTKENVKTLLKNMGQDPNSFEGQWAAMIAAPVSTKVMQAEAAAKEPPGQAGLRKAQTGYYEAQTKMFTGEGEPETGTGTVAPPGSNTFAPNTTVNPGGSVQELPPGAPLPIGRTQTGGTKYISAPYSPRQKAIIGTAGASPEQFDFDAVMYAYGNTNVAQGYRSYKGVNPVTVLRSRAAQYWMDKGLSPQEANAAMIEFKAMAHGANTAATIDARMTEAMAKAENTAKVVMPLVNKVDRTKFKDFNDFMVNARKRTGNQDEIRLGIALETLATNYGASLGMGNSVITDAKLKQAENMLEQGWDQGQLGAAVDQIMQELKREEAGTRQGMHQFLGNMSQEQNASGTTTAPSSGTSGTSSGGEWKIERIQ